MKKYTFIIQGPSETLPETHSFKCGSIVAATNNVMRNKKLQGFKILEAYCGNKTAKTVYQSGFVVYEYLAGKVVEMPAAPKDEPATPSEFGGLLDEVDTQCGQKTVTD